MILRAFLLAGVAAAALAVSAQSVFAEVDPPAASKADGRMRVVQYDPDNPTELEAAVGASLRIRFGDGETIEQVVVSDQDGITPDDEAPPAPEQTVSGLAALASTGNLGAAPTPTGAAAGQHPVPSCDRSLCRSVVANYLYLKPLRPLDPQPLFVQTERCAPELGGKCQQVDYTFSLRTRDGDPRAAAASALWAVRISYPARDKALAAYQAKQRRAIQVAAWHARQAITPPPADTAASCATCNFAYGYQGSADLKPDHAWDDGRSTFLEYSGNRAVPVVYTTLATPGGQPTMAEYTSEAGPHGTVLRIAHTRARWFVGAGKQEGCLFNQGPDPTGRASATVAATSPQPAQGGR